MSNLIDLVDLLDFGGDPSDLVDLADVADFADIASFGDVIDSVDFLPLDATDVGAVVDFDPSDLTNFAFDSDALGDTTSVLDLDSTQFTTFDLDHIYPEPTGSEMDAAFLEALQSPDSAAALGDYVGSALGTYPQHLLSGLDHVDISVEPVDHLIGMWTPQGDGTFAIKLWNHVDQLPATTHHELAHHIFSNHPEAQDSLSQFMDTSPIMRNQGLEAFLSQYSSDDQPAEFAAQVFSYYKTKPTLLEDLDPRLFDAMNDIWHRLASGGAA